MQSFKSGSSEEICFYMCGINLFYEFVLGGVELEESKMFIVIIAGQISSVDLTWVSWCNYGELVSIKINAAELYQSDTGAEH